MPSAVETIAVELGERRYEIAIGSALLERAAAIAGPWLASRRLTPAAGTAVVVTDTNASVHAQVVAGSFARSGTRTDLIVLPAGETTKRLDVISGVYDRLVSLQADRRTLVVAAGGGVIGDAAGFAAATYARGLPFLQVPTTLLADVDSSVGGKVGINHPQAKNMIGAFHQPVGVIIDTDALATLPEREYQAGLAEVVKYGVILDAEFFGWLESRSAAVVAHDPAALRRVIARSCRLKADVVERDEFERTGLRAVLNYGHTFGHAFEALCGYGAVLHGEAVAIGMVCASRLAERLGRITEADTARQVALLESLGLPTALPAGTTLDPEDVLARMRLDKKSLDGRLRFVLPTRIGHVELVDDVPETLVREVLGRG
jgi:3-dehydroquinate synthase